MMLRVKCPQCGKDIVVDDRTVNAVKVMAKRYGLFTLSVNHGDHVVEMVLDGNASLRSIRTIPVVGGERPSLLSMIDMRPIPRKKTPPLSRLTREELMVWVYINGENTIREVSRLTGLPVGRVKAIVEILKNRGFIEDIVEVVE